MHIHNAHTPITCTYTTRILTTSTHAHIKHTHKHSYMHTCTHIHKSLQFISFACTKLCHAQLDDIKQLLNRELGFAEDAARDHLYTVWLRVHNNNTPANFKGS